MRPLLVLRPEPGAAATAARARELALEAVVAPLFTLTPRAWSPPGGTPDALLLTSANAVRLAGPLPPAWRALPVYAVGRATAGAAADAGLRVVHAGEADGRAAAAAALEAGHSRLLHPCNADRRAIVLPGAEIEDVVVYAADPVEALPPGAAAVLRRGPVALLHSPAAAALFARLIDRERVGRADLRVIGISAAARAAAGTGWAVALSPETPTDAAMLALAAPLCQDRVVPTEPQP